MGRLVEVAASASLGDWASIVTAALTLLTLFAIYRQIKYAVLTYSADHVAKLRERFLSMEGRESRQAAAKSLIHARNNDVNLQEKANNRNPEDDLFDFFEGVAFQVQIGLIDKTMTHRAFYVAITMYYWAGREYIVETQKLHPLIWEGFTNLARDLYLIEQTLVSPGY